LTLFSLTVAPPEYAVPALQGAAHDATVCACTVTGTAASRPTDMAEPPRLPSTPSARRDHETDRFTFIESFS
jgi:hypothetical protein